MSWRGLVVGSVLVADLIITVHPGADLDSVADQLAKAGLQVQDKLHAVGSITGSAQDKDIPQLRGVPGVADVSQGHTFQLNPPGTPR
jgi:hypothetical protein